MTTNPTERQQRFIDMAAEHADDFKLRVAEHDADSSFPHENVAAMKASGYTALIVPEELGGGGATPLDIAHGPGTSGLRRPAHGHCRQYAPHRGLYSGRPVAAQADAGKDHYLDAI